MRSLVLLNIELGFWFTQKLEESGDSSDIGIAFLALVEMRLHFPKRFQLRSRNAKKLQQKIRHTQVFFQIFLQKIMLIRIITKYCSDAKRYLFLNGLHCKPFDA